MAIESAVPAPQPQPESGNQAATQPVTSNLPFASGGSDIYNGNSPVGPGHVATSEDFLPLIKPNS